MSARAREVLAQALQLPPTDRAEVVEVLLASSEFQDRQKVDELWATESEDRISAYERGEIGTTPAADVFDGIDQH